MVLFSIFADGAPNSWLTVLSLFLLWAATVVAGIFFTARRVRNQQRFDHGSLKRHELWSIEKRKKMDELEQVRVRQGEASRLVLMGQIAADVAHEINNPLTVIMGKAWMLEEKLIAGQEIAPAQLSEALKKISQYSQRIGKLVKSLRALSRDPSSDPLTIVSFSEILTDTMVMCADRFRNHGVQLRVDVLPSDLSLRCRPTQISQILVNLLNNAFDSAWLSESPSVVITLNIVDSHIEVRVTDSGPGVAVGLEKRIFEPFFTTKELGKGTGLGLSISTGIAHDHGGTLSLDLGRSRSCFLLRLPRIALAEKEIA